MTGWVALPVLISSSATRLAWLTGMAKPSPIEPAWPPSRSEPSPHGADGGVDADDAGFGVEERATGVAGVDGRVGLQGVDVRHVTAVAALAARGDGPLLGADDAGGDRAGQVEGGADGDDGVTDLDVVGVAERQGPQACDAADLDDGEVIAAVPAYDRGLGGVAAVERHGDLAACSGRFHDVVVGEDVAAVVQYEAGAGALCFAAADMQGDHAGQRPRGDPRDTVHRPPGGLRFGLRQLHTPHATIPLEVRPYGTPDAPGNQRQQQGTAEQSVTRELTALGGGGYGRAVLLEGAVTGAQGS